MKLKRKLIISGVISVGTLIASAIFSIIPCRTAPGIPNPVYKYMLCSLSPNSIGSLGSIREYYGYTTSLTNAYILTFFNNIRSGNKFFYNLPTKKKGKN